MSLIRQGVVNFYKNKNILITGTTGLLGTSLVEKLLRSFPQVDKIYLLARKKKSESFEERCRTYIDKMVFTRVKHMNPNFASKIVWLNGDLTARKTLGLSTLDLDTIKNDVNIVFHCAATLSFAEPLKQILIKNLSATHDLLNILKDCKSLDNFLYVSTLYSSVTKNRLHIQDKLYPPFADPFELLKMIDGLTEKEVDAKCKSFTQDSLFYYTFSKNITENLVDHFRTEFPVGIFRPGIIMGSAFEPFPYWVQGSMALERILLEVDNGYVFQPNPKARSATVPVDMVANAMLAAAYDINNHKNRTSIYNFSANSNPFTYQEMIDYYIKGIDTLELFQKRLKFNYIVPLKIIFNSSSPDAIKRKRFAFFKDITHRPYYMEYVFDNNNIHYLWNSLSDEERKLLFFDVDALNWKSYYGGMWKGRIRDKY